MTMFDVWPIGSVENGIHRRPDCGWQDIVSIITIHSRYESGLIGIEQFSHILVIFWLHRVMDKRTTLVVYPRGREELPLTGVFATRSARRPNPIAVSRARLIQRRGRELEVQGLDAVDGSSVIDIKGDLPYNDDDAVYPEWTMRGSETKP